MGFITICLRLKPLVPPPGAEPMPIFKPKGWRELTLRLLPCWCVYLQAAVCTLCARGTSVQWGVQMGGCGCAAPEVCVGCIASCPQTYRCEGCMCISVNMQLNFCMCWRKVQESMCRSLVGFASWPHCMQITTGLDVAGPGATPGLAGHWAQHPKEGMPTWRETGSSQLCLWCCSKHNTCNNKIQLSSTARCELHLPLASCVPNSYSEFLGNSLLCYFLPSSLFLVSFYFFSQVTSGNQGQPAGCQGGHRSKAPLPSIPLKTAGKLKAPSSDHIYRGTCSLQPFRGWLISAGELRWRHQNKKAARGSGKAKEWHQSDKVHLNPRVTRSDFPMIAPCNIRYKVLPQLSLERA